MKIEYLRLNLQKCFLFLVFFSFFLIPLFAQNQTEQTKNDPSKPATLKNTNKSANQDIQKEILNNSKPMPSSNIQPNNQQKKYIIYNDPICTIRDIFLPMYYYMNGSFDVLQMPETFPQTDYWPKHKLIWDMVKYPVRHIKNDGGFFQFFKDEFASIRVVPNLGLHLVGSGYDFRLLAEWYDAHGFFLPYFFSFLTVYAVHFGNEALESAGPHVTSHDALADLFFFDLAGIILYSFDPIARFFHHTLNVRQWFGQPIVNPRDGRIFNASANYMIRPRWFTKKIKPIAVIGIQNMGGLSIQIGTEHNISLLGGVTIPRPEIIEFRILGGIFYDRHGRLFASLILHGSENYNVRLNLYPEMISSPNIRIGFFAALDIDNEINVGLTMDMPVGIGF